MFARCDTLEQALHELEAGRLPNAETIVVGRRWWEALSSSQQTAYHARAQRSGAALNVDDRLSEHYVEVRGGPSDQRLSSEYPI